MTAAERANPPRAVLAAVGIDGAAAEVRALSRSWLADTFAVRTGAGDGVLKVHRLDLTQRIAADPDPRMRTFALTFPIAPFFAPSARTIDAARQVLGERAPRVLGEGRLADGSAYTWMSRVRGSPWRPGGAGERRRLARAIGEVLARLHAAPFEHPLVDAELWRERCAEILHCLCDHVPAAAHLPGHRRHRYHLRLLPVLDRLGSLDLGPFVLAHGDAHPANLLFDAGGGDSGVVDFQLACSAPASLDFRWLSMLDEREFLAAYGRPSHDPDAACWLGHCFDLLWQGMALVAMARYSDAPVPAATRIRYASHFDYLLRLCGDARLRRARPWRRRATIAGLRLGAALRRNRGAAGARPTRDRRDQIAIVVPTFNRFATTTGPCLAAVRRFSDTDYRLLCVDNASTDHTRLELQRLAAHDPRVEIVLNDANEGWANGSLRGLARLRPTDTHVLLLNSDTVPGPRWLSKLLWHLERAGPTTLVIANEDRAGTAPVPAITPGTGLPGPLPELAAVLQRAARLDRAEARESRPAAPSGFCALFPRSLLPVVSEYLAEFDRYHRGELDWRAFWSTRRVDCRMAADCYVFHARGGSGGYYRYAPA